MSHFTKIKTKLMDKECLIEALHNLEYPLKMNAMIKGYSGRTTRGDIVINTGKGYDVGFIKSDDDDDSYEIVADWYGAGKAIGKTQPVFVKEVFREYTVQKVLREAKKRGFRLSTRTTTETGELKLLVVKRGWSS